MQPTVVYLIRHGEPDNPEKKFYGRFLDIGLSSIGRSQIQSLYDVIKQKDGGLDVLLSSSLRRTKESAAILADAFRIPFTTDDALLETDAKGFEGTTLEEALGLDLSHLPEGMSVEYPEKVAIRMEEVIKKVVEEHKGKRIGLVSHGGPIAFVMSKLVRGKVTQDSGAFDPQKGSAWRLTFSPEGTLVHHEHVRSDEQKNQKEEV